MKEGSKIEFLITTCQREQSCNELVSVLRGKGRINIVNDGCSYNINGTKQIKFDKRNGKNGYWRVVNALFAMRGDAEYYFVLPDDFTCTEGSVETAVLLWDNIDDKQKICLNLYADRIGDSCWTHFISKDVGDIYLTQWVDMCFICGSKFFDVLGTLPRLGKSNSDKVKRGSSGVGKYISHKLYNGGYNLYQVKNSLFMPSQYHWNSKMYELG